MTNILVTGGAGFIGSHTVVELVAAGYNPVIIDDFSNSERFVIDRITEVTGKPVTMYDQNVSNADALRSVIEKEQITGVIHFAAFKQVGGSVTEPLRYYRNNIGGLVTLLEVCEQTGVRQVVFSSSAAIYGEPDNLPITEQAAIKPATSPYGATKQMGETILRDASAVSGSFSSLALRYFNPTGAHQSGLLGELPKGVPANLIPFVTQTAAGLRPELIVHGNDYDTPDGSCVRDYIHVVDLAKAHVTALQYLERQAPASFDAINIGTGHGASVLEVIRSFEAVNNVALPYKIGPRRPGDVVSCYAAVDKARELLGWQANLTLDDALRDAWQWQLSLNDD